MNIRQPICIEQLLDWAYRRQCVDKQASRLAPRGPCASPANSLAQYIQLGTRIDITNSATRNLGVRLPDDAMIVHDCVLTLGEMWIEWKEEDTFEIWDSQRAEAEGQIIEKRRGLWFRSPIYASNPSPRPVNLEQTGIVALLITHAKNGTHPESYADWKPPRGRMAERDGFEIDRRGRKRKGMKVDFDLVIHSRAVYLVWHAALTLLAIKLEGCLQGFEVRGPESLAMPWSNARRKSRKKVFIDFTTNTPSYNLLIN